MLSHGNTTRGQQLSVYLATNNHIPRFMYKELPIIYLVCGAILNLLFLYYLLASRKYKKALFTWMASLAVADCISCVGFAGWAAFLLPYVTLDDADVTFKSVTYVASIGVTSSGYHLMFFAGFRFYQLCFPLRARVTVTCKFVLQWCGVIWFAILVYYVPITIYFSAGQIIYEERIVYVCVFLGNLYARDMSYLILNTIIPFITILLLHLLKYIHVLRAAQTFAVQQERRNADARAITIVIIFFFVAWGPANIYVMTHTYLPGEHPYQDKLFLILVYILASSSTLNPVVYCVAAKTVRQDIVKYFCSKSNEAPKLSQYLV